MRVIIAARLSSKADEQNQSGLVSQEQESLAFAKAEGHQVVAVAADYAKGRTDMMKRPNLRPWVEDPDKIALYEAIIAYKLDRLTRGDTAETRRLEQWADEHGKKLVIVNGPSYPCEGTDGVIWDVLKRQAHQEWLNTSERYKRMQSTKRAGGYVTGRQPYGYRLVQGNAGKLIEIDPDTSKIVREMAERFLSGKSLRGIAEWLNEAGIPTPAGGAYWHYTVIRRILRSQSIIGRRVNSAGQVELEYEPILDMDTWDAVQARMATMPKAPRKDHVPSLLTGISECDQCGAIMRPIRHNKRRQSGKVVTYAYYKCNGRDGKSACANTIPMDQADDFTEAALLGILGPLELVKLQVVLGENHEVKIQDVKTRIGLLDVEADDYDAKLAEFRGELKRLRQLPVKPDEVKRMLTGETWAEHWEGLTSVEARNRWLKDGEVKVLFRKGQIVHIDVSAALGGSASGGWGVTGKSVAEVIRQTAGPDGLEARWS